MVSLQQNLLCHDMDSLLIVRADFHLIKICPLSVAILSDDLWAKQLYYSMGDSQS